MVLGIPGTENIGDFVSWKSFSTGIGLFITTIVLFLVIAGILYWWLQKKKSRNVDIHRIVWWEEVAGNFQLFGEQDLARELTIPGTNVKVFYIKKKDMYLPRFTLKVGETTYFVGILKNREMVNFQPTNLNEDGKTVGVNYDHRDMRYAQTNLKAMIDRNYRQKSQPWYIQYKEVIGVVVLIFVTSACFWFLFDRVEELLRLAGQLIENADKLVDSANAGRNSGVVQL